MRTVVRIPLIRDRLYLLHYFEQHNRELEKTVGYSRKMVTYRKYVVVYRHLAEFVNFHYGRSDYPLKKIKPSFIRQFENFLLSQQRCSHNTVWAYMIVFKHIMSLARSEGLIVQDPFACYVNRYQAVDRGYLTEGELSRFMTAKVSGKVEECVRDLFVFSAFTGLCYADIRNLTTGNIRKLFDGNLWIVTRRQKTGTETKVRLLDVPLLIIKKYEGCSSDGHLFKVPSNNCCNEHLKILQSNCGISTHLSFHVGRHTFATLSLNRGLPIESVSRILGHTNIKTTQIYAKITDKRISKDMGILDDALTVLQKKYCDKFSI